MSYLKMTVGVMAALSLIAGCTAKTTASSVTLREGIDVSAGGDAAYIVAIDNATFYLEKSGGGLSSMLDKDGVDWLGFNKKPGSAHKGEYRGFPNAVHKQDGNYFHAMNAGTDPSSGVVEIETDDHVRIVFTSENKAWEGQWDFHPDRLDFTMSRVSPGHKYWVQYEGVPGGEMDRTDFRYSSADSERHLIDQEFIGDLPSPEWMAFGDPQSPRMIYMFQHKDDDQPNDYVSRPDMTVLGFGRRNKDKFLTTPQTFSIGFAETTDYQGIRKVITSIETD